MRIASILFYFISGVALNVTVSAQQDSSSELSSEILEELAPQMDKGPRLVEELSEQAQHVRRRQLMGSSSRIMPPVPPQQKKAMFDQMIGMSSISMRDLFNFMTFKLKANCDLSFDDVIETMELKANEVYFKKVGHSEFWRDVSANSGLTTLRVEILQFCDAAVGRRMLDFSPEFSIFIPCRITVIEDATGEIWLMTMDWDVSWLAKAWQPGSKLAPDLVEGAQRIRDAMTEIMEAEASGDW